MASAKTLQTVLVLAVWYDSVQSSFKHFPPADESKFTGESVLLTCNVENPKPNTVQWEGPHSLVVNSGRPEDISPRMTLHSNSSLQIDQLTLEDSGTYTCHAYREHPYATVTLTKTLQVRLAPRIDISPEGTFVVRKGENVKIFCRQSGWQTISWRKDGSPLEFISTPSSLTFKADHWHLAGYYECVGSNDHGESMAKGVNIEIHDAPIVTTDRPFVNSAVGLSATLSATVLYDKPPATTRWYKNGKRVELYDRVKAEVHGQVHELIFRTVRNEDFANYTFRAENANGMENVHIVFSGLPDVPVFKVNPQKNAATPTTYTLRWETDSYSPVIDYTLKIRPLSADPQSPNEWRVVGVPGDESSGPTHAAAYTLSGLTPATSYEAQVVAHNTFGWSKESKPLHFSTSQAAHGPTPASIDRDTGAIVEPAQQQHKEQVLNAMPGAKSAGREMRPTAILVLTAIFFFLFS